MTPLRRRRAFAFRLAAILAIIAATCAGIPESHAAPTPKAATGVPKYSVLTRLGAPDTQATSIAVGPNGDIYLAGTTNDIQFPRVHAAQPQWGFGFCPNLYLDPCPDAFVAKLTPNGKKILYSTFLGGSDYDGPTRIAVDSRGDAFVVGTTFSPDFPEVNPLLGHSATAPTESTNNSDAFVAEFGPSGRLLMSDRFGGSQIDRATGVAVDPSGLVYIAGSTASWDFPLVNPAPQEPRGGPVWCNHGGWTISSGGEGPAIAFVAKLDPHAHRVIYSMYLGCGEGDEANAIAADAAGDAIVVGHTGSQDFPIANAFQPTLAPGTTDAFVTKLNPAGTGLVYSTYLGGSDPELASDSWTVVATDIAVDATGDATVTGYGYTTNFPLLHPVGATPPHFGNFAARFGPGGQLDYSTFLPQGGASMTPRVVLGPHDTAEFLDSDNHVSVLSANGPQALPGYTLPRGLVAAGIAVDPSGRLLACGIWAETAEIVRHTVRTS